MSININNKYSLQAFAQYANLAADTRVRIVTDHGADMLVPPETLGEFDTTEADVGVFARTFKTQSGKDQAEENNFVRTKLMEALSAHYQGTIPDEVRRSLVGSSLKGAHDMDGWTKAGDSVTSGRPLTSRRIKAVIDAVKAYDADQVAKAKDSQKAEMLAPFVDDDAEDSLTTDVIEMKGDLDVFDQEDASDSFKQLMSDCGFEVSGPKADKPKTLKENIRSICNKFYVDHDLESLKDLLDVLAMIVTHSKREVVRMASLEAGSTGYLINGLYNALKVDQVDDTTRSENIKNLAQHSSLGVVRQGMKDITDVEFKEFIRTFIEERGKKTDSGIAMTPQDHIVLNLLAGLGKAVYGPEW